MGIKQDQWIRKIKSWVPSWFYNDEGRELENSYIIALAKILESAEIDIEYDHAMTFVLDAVAGFLDMKGDELGISRLSAELDPSYRIRLQNGSTQSNTDVFSIKKIVDKFLIQGESTILEDFNNDLFLNNEVFLNRSNLFLDKYENIFSIVVDKQVADPVEFFNYESFCNTEDFIEQNDSTLEFFNIIVEAINEIKAGGTLFRFIERSV